MTNRDRGDRSTAPPQVEDAAERSLAGRLRDRRDHLVDRIDGTRVRLQDTRPESRLVDTVFRALERDVAAGGGVLAAAVAFRVFLFLVPFVFFVVVGIGFVSDASYGDPTQLAESVGIGGLVAGAVDGASGLGAGQRWTALLVSGFALFLGSRSAVKVLRITHGLIWQVPIPKLTSATRAAFAFIGLTAVSMLAAAGVGWFRDQSLLLGATALIVTVLVPFGQWLVVSAWLPHADCPWWALIPGAAIMAIGTQLLHTATVYWFSYQIASKSETYGAIGASLALLLWAYVLGRIVIASAAVNAAFWYRSEERNGRAVPEEIDLEAQLTGRTLGDPDAGD